MMTVIYVHHIFTAQATGQVAQSILFDVYRMNKWNKIFLEKPQTKLWTIVGFFRVSSLSEQWDKNGLEIILSRDSIR